MIIGTNFKLSSKKYLDNRQQCASLNDLIINKDSILYPQGFEVYCIKEKAWYQNVSEGDTPEWKIRQSGTSEGGASIDDTKISATTTWSSEYIYDMKLELQDLITQTEDYVEEIDDRLLYVEGRLTSIGSFDGSYDSLTNKPEFPSLQGYATHEYVDEVIANIGKIEGTKDYNELINQPINNVAIEYIIDGRLIVNVDYLKVGKWYIVNTDLNEEYNSATSFSLVYYLSSDSYSIINTFENEDMHSLIYVSSEDEKEIKIKYITVNGETYELIYNKETNEKTLNLLSSSGNGNGGFSGDYNDLENRPCYEDEGDIPEYLNIEIYPDTDFSDKEYVEVINGTSDNGNCITYRKYVKLFSDITIDMINTMKEYGVFISKYEGQLIENPLIDLLDESQADRGMYSIGREFEFILQAPEGYYLPENGLWYEESYIDRDLNGNLIAEYKTVDDFEGILLIKDNGELNTGTIKQLDEKFIPNTIARIEDVNILIKENGLSGDYNDLKNRPCYDDKKAGSIVMTFDGNIEGKDVIDLTDTLGCHFVRVGTGFEPPVEDMENFENTEFVKMTTMNIYEGANEENINEEAYFVVDEAYMPGTYFISGLYGAVFVFTTRQGNGSIVPEGTWFAYSPNNFYISRIECNGMTGEFKELDPKFVPYKPGEKVDGQKFIIDDVEYTSNVSAEIFNINNIAVGKYSHAEGHQTIAMEESTHSEGQLTRASGRSAHAEGYKTTASGNDSHAEGLSTIASGQSSHAEGSGTKATGENAHAEGNITEAIGTFSHAEGHRSKAIGHTTHAEGRETEAAGNYSHVEGYKTKASSNYQHVQGKHNIEDIENKYAHIVGNGTGTSKRSNAHTLDWNGNAWYQGNVSIEGTPTNDNDLTTKKYVDDLVSNVDIDLSDYITDTELEEKGYITEIPSEYITNTELEGKGYVTDTELEEEMTFETDSLTVNSLGGISANTDLNGLTVKEILNKLLFPYIESVITVAATPNGGTYEKGNNQTITNVKVVVTKKSEKITKIEVLNGTQVLARQQDEAINNGGTFNYNVNVSVPSTNKQLTVKVTDNSGNAITKTTNAFTFVYPYYYGVCDEGTIINGDLIKSLTKSVETKGTKAITYTTNNQRMIFAYPKSYGVITKILDPNSFDVTSTFTMSQITIIGLDGTGQSYYVYVNSPSTVSNFNMKFSY